jgi:glutamate formiminotransferase/formiminotetrahydrofolate cyclodeaminase
LDSEDVSIAKEIARTVRFSSGGLPFVKALGMFVDGRAQVSMNLTDFTQTPVAKVVELIRSEAKNYGTDIHHSELVGLIPQAAMVDAAQWYLQLEDFNPNQVLETRLYAAREDVRSLEGTFLEELAAGTATPGGGSAAAYGAAMAASLVSMVARLSIGKKKFKNIEDRMFEIVEESNELRMLLNDAVHQDAKAFNMVMEAYSLPKENESEITARKEAIEKATHKASEVPLGVVKQVTRVLELAKEVASFGNANAITDAGSAGSLAMAAITAAGMNVRINAHSVSDQAASEAWIKELGKLEKIATEIYAELKQIVAERGGIEIT